MTIFRPAKANVLQLDIDTDERMRHFQSCLPWLAIYLKPVAIGQWRSRTPGHWHIEIVLPENKPLVHRIALQCILGSDLVRERWDYTRLLRESAYPIVFIERSHRACAAELQ